MTHSTPLALLLVFLSSLCRAADDPIADDIVPIPFNYDVTVSTEEQPLFLRPPPAPPPYLVQPSQTITPPPSNSFMALTNIGDRVPPDTMGAVNGTHVM